ncbi:MAG: DUF4910 domain-containing protein [Thermodesulfobacteriota bacterium]
MFPIDTLKRILAMNVGISQPENEGMFDLLSTVYPLTVRRYRSGSEHNGWVIPHSWRVLKASIEKEGKTLFDGTSHPLAVAGYSRSFHGSLAKAELDKKVFYRKDFPDAYAFHCIYIYRPWMKDWGFCIPFNDYRGWGEGMYQVDLKTELSDGDMLVGEAEVRGELSQTIVFCAHTCHPCQANDDMAGVITVLRLFQRLSRRKNRYTYLAVLGPEYYGTVFYLADLPKSRLSDIRLGCFVEMPGSHTPFALQRSLTGDTILDRIAEHVLLHADSSVTIGDFACVVGNDESVWEAPGIEVPMVSISRWPYPEYHTSADNVGILSEEKLDEMLSVLEDIVYILENDCTIHRKFDGLVALSNPKYNLYFEHPDPVVAKELSDMDLRFAKMQDYLQRFFNGRHTVFEICTRFGIPFKSLLAYLKRFEERGLVELHPVVSLSSYDEPRHL